MDDDFDFDVDFNDIQDPDNLGGKDNVFPGDYHMLVESMDPSGGHNGGMKVDFQILRGTIPGQERKIFSMTFSKDYGEVHRAKLGAFAVAARLKTADGRSVTNKLISDVKAKGESVKILWGEALNRTVCMKLVLSKDGKYVNLDWDKIWSPDDKRAAHIPLHAAALQRDGIKLPTNRPIDGVLAKPATGSKTSGASTQKSKASEVGTDDLLDGVV